MDADGCLQLCTGRRAGCEAAVHAMREIFTDEGTEGILLVDASNARQVWYADDAAAGGGMVCCILGIGGLGCCHWPSFCMVIMLMLLRLGWLLSRDTWLRLSASLMVLASRLRLLVGPIWVHLSAPGFHCRLYTGSRISVG